MNRRHELLEQAKIHYAADMLMSGTYGITMKGWEFRGCSVGCHLHHILPDTRPHAVHNKHKVVADYYGYPEWLAHLQDAMFEELPEDERNLWHVQLAEAISATPDDHDWKATFHRVHAAVLRVCFEHDSDFQLVIAAHDRAAKGEAFVCEQTRRFDHIVLRGSVTAATHYDEFPNLSVSLTCAFFDRGMIRDAILGAIQS